MKPDLLQAQPSEACTKRSENCTREKRSRVAPAQHEATCRPALPGARGEATPHFAAATLAAHQPGASGVCLFPNNGPLHGTTGARNRPEARHRPAGSKNICPTLTQHMKPVSTQELCITLHRGDPICAWVHVILTSLLLHLSELLHSAHSYACARVCLQAHARDVYT